MAVDYRQLARVRDKRLCAPTDEFPGVQRSDLPRTPPRGNSVAPVKTEDTHSPGPWRWDSRKAMERGYVDLALEARDGDGVAYHSAVWPVLQADARLIAAAPDLLAACKELHDALAIAMQVIVTDGSNTDVQTERFVFGLTQRGIVDGIGQRAEAAIAKAEAR